MNTKIRKGFLSVAIAAACFAMPLMACNNEDDNADDVAICPVTTPHLYAYGVSLSKSSSVADESNVLFTEDDIEWFDVKTRELRFKESVGALYEKLQPFHKIQIRLNDETLFEVSSFVGLWDSRIFDDLVLCYGNQETIAIDGCYYLYDCYPLQIFANSETVKSNIAKNAAQWKTFVEYLDSKGKLKK